jgi:hypothetical protein
MLITCNLMASYVVTEYSQVAGVHVAGGNEQQNLKERSTWASKQ